MPHVVDLKWRLNYTTKTSQLERVNEPQYTVTLLTEVRATAAAPSDACASLAHARRHFFFFFALPFPS